MLKIRRRLRVLKKIYHLIRDGAMGLKNICRSIFTACLRRKPLEISSDISTNLERCLSTLDLTFIGIGSTLGAGIYVLTGQVARNKAGPAVVLSFFMAAVASVLSGLCYAEFGARFPKAGSAYVYCYVAIGEFCAFFIGWNVLMEYIIGAAAITKGVSSYIDSLANGIFQNTTISLIGEIEVHGLNHYFDVFSVMIVIIFTIVLALGVKNSTRLNNLLVILNILTILVVTVVGFIHADPKNWSNFAPFGFRGIVRGASTCFFAFIGFDVIATTCEEARNPGKSIPFSILGTIVICCLAYLGVSAAITLMVPYDTLDPNAAVSTAFGQRGLKPMVYIVGMGATLGLLGCTLVSLMAPPRLLYAMSKDGLIPKAFSFVNSKTNIPLFGTITGGFLIALMAAILDLDSLVEMLSIGTLLAYSIVDISVLVLRYRVPVDSIQQEGPYLYDAEDNSDDSSVPQGPSMWEKIMELQKSQFVINAVIFIIILEILAACLIIDKFSNSLIHDPFCITVFVVLVLFIFGNGLFLYRLKGNTEGLCFIVPFVPWIPMLALASNFCLMLELGELTWIRFIVWMSIGILVYLAYSMHYSIEGMDRSVEPEYSPFTSCTDEEINNSSEKTPLVQKGSKGD